MAGEDEIAAYSEIVSGIPFGKTLPDAIYVHASAIPALPKPCWLFVARAQTIAKVREDQFNVIKFSRRKPRVSLLHYPRFFEDGFPVLNHSWAVRLAEGSHSEQAYAAEKNPPILHRKELLLPRDHPAVPDFATLTRQVSEFGLLDQTNEIGFLLPWQAKLDRLKLEIRGNEVCEVGEAPSQARIQRERTALSRYALSSPVQALWRHGYLDGSRTLFDYGCGRGDDIRILGSLGVQACGWDPYFHAEGDRTEADLVNIGFVLNVIEDREERAEALLGAWKLTRQLLVVAGLVGNRSEYERHRLYRDGVLTSRGTFQKYFSQAELRDYISAVLGQRVIAVGPGLYFVFRNEDLEDAFLESRESGRPFTGRSIPIGPSEYQPARRERKLRSSKWDQHAELAEEFWQRCLVLGRMAEIEEFDRSTELREALGSSKRVFNRLLRERGSTELQVARRRRRDDILVALALEIFETKGRLRDLPARLQRDIRSFWGSHANALAEAKQALFEAGSTEVLTSDADRAIGDQLGALDERGHFTAHISVRVRLPLRFRILIGCAERIYGDLSGFDLLRIHMRSKKLSLLAFEGFDRRPLPRLQQRVKVLLAKADFLEFHLDPEDDAPLLYWKSEYLPEGFPDLERQTKFDAQLRAFGWEAAEGWPFSDEALHKVLDRRGLLLIGYRIVASDRSEEEVPGLGLIASPGEGKAFAVDSDLTAGADTPCTQSLDSNKRTDGTMTIIQAVQTVLEGTSKALSAKEIHDEIVSKSLFTFGAKDPIGMVRTTIRKQIKRNPDARPGIEQTARDQFIWIRS